MTPEEKERCISIVAQWLDFNMSNYPYEERKFWIEDLTNYLDIEL